jgi:hypothetical protein
LSGRIKQECQVRMNWQTVGPAKKDRKRKIEALPACNSAAVFSV